MTENRKLIVTHHAPDLDAIGAVWLLKRFDTQKYGTAKVAFVNPGETISISMAEQLGFSDKQITHVDTGLGEFDHHQPERGHQFICATSLVFDYICKHYPDKLENQPLKEIVNYITEIDHFREIDWPDASHIRYNFMLHELVKGVEGQDPHDDDSMLQFGMKGLDAAYHLIDLEIKAKQLIEDSSQKFDLSFGPCLAIETSNDDVIKVAQKQGFMLVIRKDSHGGHIRVKARPDSGVDLKALHEQILKTGDEGDWYYHPSGKMLLNGSSKHRNQQPTKLTLAEVINLTKESYAK